MAIDKTNYQNHKIHTIKMMYMIFAISDLIFIFHFIFLNFQFFKTVIFGYFRFMAKTPPNKKSCSKNIQNHQLALLSFTFHQKKIPHTGEKASLDRCG